MKINEVVVENDVSDVANLSAKNVSSGYDTVSKLFSPSQWFKGSVKVDDEPSTQKSTAQKSKSQKQKPAVSSTLHLEKEAVVDASQGKELFKNDLTYIKTVYSKVKSGKISVADPDTTLLALKSVLNGTPLTDQQKQTLSQLSTQL